MMLLFITSSISLSLRLSYQTFLIVPFLINSWLFQVSHSLVVQQQEGRGAYTCNSSSRSLTTQSKSFIQSSTTLATTTRNTDLLMTVANGDDVDSSSSSRQVTTTTATAADDHSSSSITTTTPLVATIAVPRHVKVLGVCGGIGSGKSAACKMLVAEFGCLAHLGMCALFLQLYISIYTIKNVPPFFQHMRERTYI